MEWQRLEQIRDEAIENTLTPKSMISSTGNKATSPVTSSGAVGTNSSSSTKEAAKATTASASAVMDSRAAVSRAVLCSAASIALQELTLGFDGDDRLDPLNIP